MRWRDPTRRAGALVCGVALLLLTVRGALARDLSADARMRFERGSELAARHRQYRDALEDFRAVLAEDPDHAPAVVSAAQCHAALGDLTPARTLYERALTLGLAPNSVVTVRRELGKLCMRLGAFDDAQAHLERARRLARADPEIAALLGDAYRKRGAPERAIGEYERALSIDADRRDAHVGLASAFLETGDSAGAVRHARSAIEIDPFDPDAWYVVTRALTKLGESDQARVALRSYTRMRAYSTDVDAIGKALGNHPENIGLAQALADRHAREGNLHAAVAAYERATGDESARQAAYTNIALLRLRQSDAAKAAVALRLASESGGEGAALHVAYGEFHTASRDWTTASVSYRAALSLSPTMTQAWVGLMRAAAMTGGRSAAEAILGEWLATNPRSSTAWNERGLLDFGDGSPDAAISALERAVALDPTNHEAANNLAWTYADTGRDLTRARELAHAVLAATPTAAAFDTLAYIEQQAGDLVAALAAIERAVSMNPTNAEYRRRRDAILRALGE